MNLLDCISFALFFLFSVFAYSFPAHEKERKVIIRSLFRFQNADAIEEQVQCSNGMLFRFDPDDEIGAGSNGFVIKGK